MDRHRIANILNSASQLLELMGENPFKVRAYENAARAIDDFAGDLGQAIAEKKLTDIKGIGKNLADHITEIAETGNLREYEELQKLVPEGVVKMLSIPGLGPKRVRHIWKEIGVSSVGELETLCTRHRLANSPGFGEKMEGKILAGIEMLKQFAGKRLFAEAFSVAKEVLTEVKSWPQVKHCEICGSLRRRKEIIGDIDILVATKEPKKVMKRFISAPFVKQVRQHGETKSEVILSSGIQCDLRAVDDTEFPFALHYFTGSKEHNIAMRSRAKKASLRMSEYGLFKGNSAKSIPCYDEEAIFKTLGLSYIEPELREGQGEIEAAAEEHLPLLVNKHDIKGVLHVHTSQSDGRASLDEMVCAARDRGYSYLLIADHSQSSTIANGLEPARVAIQHCEIEALNKKLKDFQVLKGIEVDILPDGSLDFGDDVLATFDIVIAAVHSRFGMAEKEMTERIVRALSNPYVDILAHPTGRLLLAREPYAIDLNAVIEAAAKHEKIIEINAHPQRLDLDWRWCRHAKARGIKFAIDPDAHTPEGLDDIEYGINVARKGWLEKKDIINCMPVDELIKYISKRKGRGGSIHE